ncbi:MAG: hypothetical protein QXD79_07245 [Candidatus Methanomethylicia archaeon]
MEKFQGYETVPIAFFPDRKLSILHIDFHPNAKSSVGILRDITAIIAMHRIPIVGFHSSGNSTVFFLDVTGKSVEDIERMKTCIQDNVKFIEKLYIKDSEVKGFAIDSKAYPPTLLSERVLILRESAFKSIIEGVIKSLKFAPQVVLYIIGREMGEQYYDVHTKMMNIQDKEDLIKVSEYLFAAVGFGKPERIKVDLENLEFEYDVYDCIECKINFEAGRKIKSSLIRGLIEGYYTKLLGREVECIEEECITQEKEKCKFKIKPIEIKA